MQRPITRRAAVAAFAGCLAARQARAAPAGFPDQPTIMVAGPIGGRTYRWAETIAEPLGKAMQQGPALTCRCSGGPDGVTGANQFQARALPDGGTALLVPGAAALSWLVGDTRVRFDAGQWVPLWSGETSLALASRSPLSRARPLRLGVRSVDGPDLAALLALELGRIEVIPVAVSGTGRQLLERPDLDLVLLRGAEVRAAAGSAAGWTLALAFGRVGPNGIVPDPSLPELMLAQDLAARGGHERAAELTLALNAVAAAAKLDTALVLPQASPSAVVAWWRQGCAQISSTSDVQAEATRTAVRPLDSGDTAASIEAIVVDPPVLLELRRWLAERYNWRPA